MDNIRFLYIIITIFILNLLFLFSLYFFLIDFYTHNMLLMLICQNCLNLACSIQDLFHKNYMCCHWNHTIGYCINLLKNLGIHRESKDLEHINSMDMKEAFVNIKYETNILLLYFKELILFSKIVIFNLQNFLVNL